MEEARYRLANAVLSVAHEESRNVDALATGALEAIAQRYKNKDALGAPFTDAT